MIRKHSILLVAFVLAGAALLTAESVSAQSKPCGCYCNIWLPAPCSDQACKNACGWRDPNQTPLPNTQPTPSGPTQEELDRQAREREADRIRKEKERKQQEAAIKAAEEAAKQADFLKKRDEAVTELKGIDSSAPSQLKEIPQQPTQPKSELKESDYFYALQTRTLTPMNDGGNAIDAPDAPVPKKGLHGLVGGTTWTFGFKWPRKNCDDPCKEEIKKALAAQLRLFCASQKDPKQCESAELPFSPEMYDMVVSLGSAHTFLEDFATRVLWDQTTFGKFSIEHKEVFASLKGRKFDTLDCHSNGALLCLAALRSGETTAKEVRLFGPQVSPEAMRRWRALAAKPPGMKITIYLNEGDPIPALSWNLPAPRTKLGTASTLAWFTDVKTLPSVLSKALVESYFDSSHRIMDQRLKSYGFTVIRNRDLDLAKCAKMPNPACHSMKLYESRIVPLK